MEYVANLINWILRPLQWIGLIKQARFINWEDSWLERVFNSQGIVACECGSKKFNLTKLDQDTSSGLGYVATDFRFWFDCSMCGKSDTRIITIT